MITEQRMRSHSKSVLQFSATILYYSCVQHISSLGEKKKKEKTRNCKIPPGRTKLSKIILFHNSVIVFLSFEGDTEGKRLNK